MLLSEFDFTAARGIGDLHKELLSTGCTLVLLEPSKEVLNVLKGAINTTISCVYSDVDLDGHLSDLVATNNSQLKESRDVVIPLLIGDVDAGRQEESTRE